MSGGGLMNTGVFETLHGESVQEIWMVIRNVMLLIQVYNIPRIRIT